MFRQWGGLRSTQIQVLAMLVAAPQTAVTSAPAAASAAVVKVAAVGALGDVLTDTSGFTLYVFTKDVPSSGKSACAGSCAVTWPPLVAPSSTLANADRATAVLAVITRDDGTLQVTYGGRPLYRFASDKRPGDATGQGINSFGGVWSVATGQPGAAATTPPTTPQPAATSTGGTYGY